MKQIIRIPKVKGGASLLKTRTGSEIQAGVSVGKRGIHVGVGYDKRRKSAGADVTYTKGKKSKSASLSARYRR